MLLLKLAVLQSRVLSAIVVTSRGLGLAVYVCRDIGPGDLGIRDVESMVHSRGLTLMIYDYKHLLPKHCLLLI